MFNKAGSALKRFWLGLSSGKYVAGDKSPVNFENLQPIPVVQVMTFGAADGDKGPKMYVPMDENGFYRVHDSVMDAVQDNIYTNQGYMRSHGEVSIPARFTDLYTPTSTVARFAKARIGLVSFASDAAGNLAADVELVAALSGYYGVIKWIGLFSVGNAGGTATLVAEGNAGIVTLVSGTLVAGQLDTANANMIVKGDADNQNIYLDTTSSGLGNTQSYFALFEYWYET